MRALLIVDMQNDFMPGGPLAVNEADQLIAPLNLLMAKFAIVVASQDWHPPQHVSFAATHPGKAAGKIVKVDGEDQRLWATHCIADTKGAELVDGLNTGKIACSFLKGRDPKIESYSAFFDNRRQKATGLEKYLRSRNVDQLYVAGVATDYCVLYSVLDAIDLGFEVHVALDCCKGIDAHHGDSEKALQKMKSKGAHLVFASEISREAIRSFSK